MNLIYSAFLIFCLSLRASSQTLIELTDVKSSVTWNPSTDESVTIQADEGYQIELNVTKCDLDGDRGDYVVIKNDVDDADDEDDYSEMMFTYDTGGTDNYLYESNKIVAEYVAKNTSSTFIAVFTRKGEALTTTTTEIPITTIILPTPESDQDVSITVYLSGASAQLFTNDSAAVRSLKQILAQMATEYASVQNFPINGSITPSNVIIDNIEQCHITWNNYDQCISLTFAIPVNLIDDATSTWTGYQFNEQHLKMMWDKLGAKYVTSIGLKVYSVPNIDGIWTKRLLIISLVIVFFVIIVLSVRCVNNKYSKRRRRKFSDTVSIVGNSNRNSQLSLTPHYLQETPPLFGTDSFQTFPSPSSIIKPDFTDSPALYDDFNDVDENSFEIKEKNGVVVADIIN